MLIDTHCHVHIGHKTPAGKAAAGCCGPSVNAATNICDSRNNDSTSSSSVLSHQAEASAAVAVATAAEAGIGGLKQDDLISSNDERAPGEQEQGGNLKTLPRVVHITMGICEEDWSRAISLGRIDNFSGGAAVFSPMREAEVPHHKQLQQLLRPPSARFAGERGKDEGTSGGAARATGCLLYTSPSPRD